MKGAPRIVGALLLGACFSRPSRGALVTSASESLSGLPAPEIAAETVDGKIYSRPAGPGRPTCISFFASWCPVCQAENQELRQIQAALSAKGIESIGVLVDPLETPDTLEEARKGLKANPLPYTVVLLDDNLRSSFQYQSGGFPATYFISGDGTFTTTLYGFHSKSKLMEVADHVVPASGQTAASAVTRPTASGPSSEAPHPAPWNRSPSRALVPTIRKQVHPLIVHFPIAFLGLELGFVLALLARPREPLATFSRWLLWFAAISFVPAIYTGIRDVGADLGGDWTFWSGLQDRVRYFTRLESTVSLHVLIVLVAATLTLSRLAWRVKSRDNALAGSKRYAFAFLTIVGFWLIFAAGQVGGSISHP